MRCPQCGFTTFPHASTCKECGRPLSGMASGPEVPPLAEGAAPPPPSPPASSWWGTGLPQEVAAELDPERLDLKGLSLPRSILEARGRAEAEPPAGAAPVAGTLTARRYGGFWLRGMAALVDSILAGALAALAGAGAVVAAGGGGVLAGGLDVRTDFVAVTAALLAAAGVSLAYHTLFTGTWAQTPGKMFFGLTVARPDGGAVSYGRAAWRWTASWLALGLLGIGVLLIAVTPRKQGLHDLLAGTVVLRQPAGSS